MCVIVCVIPLGGGVSADTNKPADTKSTVTVKVTAYHSPALACTHIPPPRTYGAHCVWICLLCIWLLWLLSVFLCFSILYVQKQFAKRPVCVYVWVCVAYINPFSLPSIHQAVSRSRPHKDSSQQPQYQLLKYICLWESSSPSLSLFLILLLLLLLLKIEQESDFKCADWCPEWNTTVCVCRCVLRC